MDKPVDLQEPLDELARDPTRFAHDLKFPPADKIRVYDDTLRDGEQMPGVAIAPKDKYELARMLSDIGVHIMDVGFPSVSESERETLRLVLGGRKRGELRPDLEVVCMMRSTTGDIDATMKVIDSLGYKRDEVTYFIFTSASDLHVKYKLGKTLLHREGVPESEWLEMPIWFYRAANLRMMCDAIRYAREQGATSIEFGGEDGSRADVDYIAEIHAEGLRAGGTRPSTPDTVGCYSPFAVREYIPKIKAAAPDAPLVVHFHNDLGIGAWNTVVALGSGAEVFTTSVNGIGERTGNAPMHQVLLQLRYLSASRSRASSTRSCATWRAISSGSAAFRSSPPNPESASTSSPTSRAFTRRACLSTPRSTSSSRPTTWARRSNTSTASIRAHW